MSVQPKNEQIFKLACQRLRKNNLKILWRSGYFRTFHLYFCQCLLSFCLPRWYSWSCRALFLARYFILLDYNTIKAVPIARLARYRFHSKITSIRRIAASISTYHVPVLKPLTTFYIALKRRRRRKGKMKDYYSFFLFYILTEFHYGVILKQNMCIISHFEREAWSVIFCQNNFFPESFPVQPLTAKGWE